MIRAHIMCSVKPDLYLKEYFADYAPILPSLFSLNHIPTAARPFYGSSPNSWDAQALDQSVQGIIAVLLSLKKKPVIRYEKSSPMAKKLGVEIQVPLGLTLQVPQIADRFLASYTTRVVLV